MDTNEVSEFVYVLNYICDKLENSGQVIPRINITNALMDFNGRFKDGVTHIYNFITWMGEHGYNEHEILPTIVHDLNGMYDSFFSPRTGGY